MTSTPHPEIAIEAVAEFLAEQSDPAEDRYVFAYRITIRNQSRQPAQLISRHWIITDGNGAVEEVRGIGVIGEQPLLQPGESFQYQSGCVLKTPVGTMEGSYQMSGDDGQRFDAPIPPFVLAMPRALH